MIAGPAPIFAASLVTQALSRANVDIGGSRPWDIRVHNSSFYSRLIKHGSLGLGESYVEGWWDVDQLDEFIVRLLQADLDRGAGYVLDRWRRLLSMLQNRQGVLSAVENSKHHYDRDVELYKAMLDSRMVYSCGYWKDVSNLEKAQEAKLELICRKLELMPGMDVLDIGCGWGGFAAFAAERFGVRVVGVTVSRAQAQFATEVCRNLPVDIKVMDYRELTGTYDRIVSVGMFEHVGVQNHRKYMQVIHQHLRDGGLFLLQTISGNESVHAIDPWIDKHIFPGTVLPSIKQIGAACEQLLVAEDWHNFGPDYDRTLMSWFENFHGNWPRLRLAFDDRFYRTWKYYLLTCAATFRTRRNQLWQVVFSKQRPGCYTARR